MILIEGAICIGVLGYLYPLMDQPDTTLRDIVMEINMFLKIISKFYSELEAINTLKKSWWVLVRYFW